MFKYRLGDRVISIRDEHGDWTDDFRPKGTKGEVVIVELFISGVQALTVDFEHEIGRHMPWNILNPELEIEPEGITKKVQEALLVKYSTDVRQIDPYEEEKGFWLAFHRAFGHSVCSATGDTKEEAIESLQDIKEGVIRHYIKECKKLPNGDA